ncbi:MAG: beta-ketoacyl synthase [Pseudomonadales bacterium]|nr:beta-ketoacyl synthase [Pseudomonadales bacterium]
MVSLPVIVGFGGINSAGRGSFHHAYRRTLLDDLPSAVAEETLVDLAVLMNQAKFENGQLVDLNGVAISSIKGHSSLHNHIIDHTLIRRIESQYFDPAAVPFQRKMKVNPCEDQPLEFVVRAKQLPAIAPEGWQYQSLEDGKVKVTVEQGFDMLLPDTKIAAVSSAGQLPTGFDPKDLYPSRNHPRGLQMAIYAASDALGSIGIDWQIIADSVAPDQIAVYASSSMGQLDDCGTGGMYKAPHIGKRITSKQLPLGFAEMPADFINAYVLGNVGATGGHIGACATFLYNLRAAVSDIQSGKRRVVLVGTSEATINPEAMEGYAAMGALASDAELLELDKALGLTTPNYRRACRPFGQNCGFTMGESSQFIVLFDDKLALELGAPIHGAVPDVFVHADGYKKSIAGPGIGNYLTVAKAVGVARELIGDDALRNKTFMHAHGTSTPQNRVTESHIFNEIAKTFGIENWPIAAIKCYIGHSLGSSSADQILSALGVWKYGLIPGISTIDEVAEDVHASNLRIEQKSIDVGPEGIDASFLNSKGFGGNNATALVMAPHVVKRMLAKRHGQAAVTQYQSKLEASTQSAEEYNQAAIRGEIRPKYQFGEQIKDGDDLKISTTKIEIDGYRHSIDVKSSGMYSDLTRK